MSGNYHNKRYERCLFCHSYINLDRDSHAIIAVGMHTQHIHLGMCYKLFHQAGHRSITLKEVNHGK